MYYVNADKATVMLVLSGNSEAYGDIVHKYKTIVFNVIYAIIKNYHTAEDLTQDTFIDGYIKLKSLDEPYNVGAWLCKIAKNKCYNYMTRSAVQFESELHDYIRDSETSTPENLLMRRQDFQVVRQAVELLPDLHKTVTELYYFGNYPQTKIAEMLNIPIGTVSRRLYDARLKLKKELDNMSETLNNIDFEAEVAKKIKSLWNYYHLNNFSNDGRQRKVDEFIQFIDAMPESKLKHRAYASAYSYSDKEEHKAKVEQEAELGENSEVYFNKFWEKYANKNNDQKWLDAIDGDEGISKIEKMENSAKDVGTMYFWRGCCNMRLQNYKESRKDFEQAEKKINRDNSYHPNAIAALKAVDFLEDEPKRYLAGNVNVTGECYRLYDGGKKLDFVNQPGYGTDRIFDGKNIYDSIMYYCSGRKGNKPFFDLNMKEGETIGEETLVSKNETITVLAGTFDNCVHVKSISSKTDDFCKSSEVWYAKDIGLVKCHINAGYGEKFDEEIYELCKYKVNGGDGYFPASSGNCWQYKNINLPEYYQQVIEYEVISVFDDLETESKYIYTASFNALRVSYDNCDSDIYIALAEKAIPYGYINHKPEKLDFDTAINYLKCAVQKNTSVKSVLYAAAAVDYIKRFKQYYEKRWHILPCCLDAKILIKDKRESKIAVKSANGYYLAPSQDWGGWFDERKCLARSPFRYLQHLFGIIYDDNWVAGYSEQIKHEDGEIYLKSEYGGTITTKAGTFENCIKVTVELEKNDETDEKYYINTPRYSHCGTKIYYYAPNVGIVKYECIWGRALYASMELTEYKSYATNGEYMPIYIGNEWVYDEVTFEPEFMEKSKFSIVSGMEDEFFMLCEGDVLFMGTDKEYETFKKKREK